MKKRPKDRRIALVLQGGGALGAYQAGVYQALDEAGLAPEWVAGTSIGALNGGIIAGNEPALRLDRLRQFWNTLCFPGLAEASQFPLPLRQAAGFSNAMLAVFGGLPGFFSPRPFPPLVTGSGGSAQTASYYDTGALRRLLEEVVNFDYLKSKAVRYSMGAVNVTSGEMRYFDNYKDEIGPENMMASGALPPGFPAIEVKEELWWDGGLYSNTPLEWVLDNTPRRSTLCFMVDLFNPSGPEPRSISEVEARRKSITYATRSKRHIKDYELIHNLRNAVRELHRRLGDEHRSDPVVQHLADLGCDTTMEIVHLGYADRDSELATKDVDFSHSAIEERWARGLRDARRAIELAPWEASVPDHVGVVVHDMTHKGD